MFCVLSLCLLVDMGCWIDLCEFVNCLNGREFGGLGCLWVGSCVVFIVVD